MTDSSRRYVVALYIAGKDMDMRLLGISDDPQVVEPVMYRVCPENPVEDFRPLSARECAVLRMAAQGMENLEISRHLGLSRRTVDFHMRGILAKLESRNRVEAVKKASEMGLLGT